MEEVKDYDKKRVKLGKKLFFDKNFSEDKTISCASCHNDFGSDSQRVSTGVFGRKGEIQSLTVFNSSNNYRQFWNGRAKDLFEQIDFPVHNGVEMGVTKKDIETHLLSDKTYQELFREAYGKAPSYELFKDALVEFERTLITINSKFDLYLKGKVELTPSEHRGFLLFKSYGCTSCHNGKNVGGNSMQLFGNVVSYPYKKGQLDLYSITQDKHDKNVFRVPSLRNINKTAPYFHDASASTLNEAIVKMAYHNLGVVFEYQEIEDIKAFLMTLEGELPKTWVEDE